MSLPRHSVLLFRAFLITAFLWASPTASAAGLADRFIDPSDGKLDVSEWLLEYKGFLPVPIFITEPAIGYGAGVALAFFREPLQDAARRAATTGHSTPPDVFAIAAVATENGTKGAAAGGQWTFLDDRYRYRGGVGNVSLNLDFYGLAGRLPGNIEKIGYNLRGFASFQQGMMRLGASDTFAAIRWIYLDLDTRLDLSAGDAGLTSRQLARRSSGIGAAIEHDSRDNIFTPNRGWLGVLEANFYDKSFGSSNDFETYRGYLFGYWPLSSDWTLGLRADGRHAAGDVPFYMLPYVVMRGIPVARFQGQSVAAVEAEVRYDVTDRWSLVGFAGTGAAWGNSVSFADAERPVSVGAGFRYLIARRLGLYVGMDFARSTADRAFYITVGSAWR